MREDSMVSDAFPDVFIEVIRDIKMGVKGMGLKLLEEGFAGVKWFIELDTQVDEFLPSD